MMDETKVYLVKYDSLTFADATLKVRTIIEEMKDVDSRFVSTTFVTEFVRSLEDADEAIISERQEDIDGRLQQISRGENLINSE